MNVFQKYAASPLIRNYLKVFSVDVLVKATGFILLPVYLALMTEEEFGLYGYLLAIMSAFSLVFNLGIYAAQSKLYHDYPEAQRGELLFSLNVLLFAFLALLFAIIFLFRLDFPLIRLLIREPVDYEAYRVPVLLGVVVSVYAMLLVNYFLTATRIHTVQWFNSLRAVAINAIVLGVLYTQAGDHALLRVQYAVYAELALVFLFLRWYLPAMKASFNWSMARRALAIGFPIMISAILGIFINLSDRYFLEKHGSLLELSKYNLALTLASIIPFVFASFQNIWLPEVLKEKDPEVSRARTQRMVVRIGFLLLVVSGGIILLLKSLLYFGVIAPSYAEAMPVLPLVLVAAVLSSLSGMYSNQLIYLEKLTAVVVVGSVLAIGGILVNAWLVPRWHLFGAATATLLVNGGFAVAYGLLASYYHRERRAGSARS